MAGPVPGFVAAALPGGCDGCGNLSYRLVDDDNELCEEDGATPSDLGQTDRIWWTATLEPGTDGTSAFVIGTTPSEMPSFMYVEDPTELVGGDWIPDSVGLRHAWAGIGIEVPGVAVSVRFDFHCFEILGGRAIATIEEGALLELGDEARWDIESWDASVGDDDSALP